MGDKTFYLYIRLLGLSTYIAVTKFYHMKKIYRIGLTAMLIALLPTGLVFAGNGKGTKNTVEVKNSADSRTITLMVNTDDVLTMDEIAITSPIAGVSIKEVTPYTGGLKIIIDIDPSVETVAGKGNGDIIIEIVGVDNITGVGASDENTGSSFNTNIMVGDANEGDNNNGSSNGTGMQGVTPPAGTVVPYTVTGKSDVTIFPNPVIDETNVVTVGEILGKTIQIMDLSGYVVMNMVVGKNSRQTTLNLTGLTPGIYILNYTGQDGRVISKRIQKV